MSKRNLFALAVAAACLLGLAPAANAGPSSSTTATVSIGDSYISGEAGRWNGNTTKYTGNRNYTDRACTVVWYGCSFNYNSVYLEGTYDNGCHRSDVAEVRSATIAVNYEVNLACSGAVAANTWRSSNGGTSRNGESPQADRLATVAAQRNVKMVVLSIGGNDLGFADIIIDCTVRWSTSSASNPDKCQPSGQATVDSRMPGAMAGVRKSIDEIRAVMSAAGYSSSQYKLVLQSYPSPIPRAAENRYPESGWSRLDTGGCPFWNTDSNWARDSLVAQISNNLRTVAQSKGVLFMDLRDALQGKEVCSTATSQAGSSGPSETSSEWVRFLNSGCCQGDAQESMHPNAYGQRAIGRCLTLIYSKTTGGHACKRTAGSGISGMTLTQTY